MYGINSLVSTCYVTHLITHALLQSMISITSAAWRCSVPSSLAIFLLLFHARISSTYGRAQDDGSPSEKEGSPESSINIISPPRELSSNEQHALQKAAMYATIQSASNYSPDDTNSIFTSEEEQRAYYYFHAGMAMATSNTMKMTPPSSSDDDLDNNEEGDENTSKHDDDNNYH